MKEENRVVFFSKEDMAGGFELQKGEHILRGDIKQEYVDINDILELYNIKKYIDNELYLKSWTTDDINNFKQKIVSFGKIIAQFMSAITDENFDQIYQNIIFDYEKSFWELINNLNLSKNISKDKLLGVLENKSYIKYEILQNKQIVEHFDKLLKTFFLNHPESAEIVLSVYEVKKDNNESPYYLPKSLTVEDKENIIINYLNSSQTNINYVSLIPNARNQTDFKLSDKTRLLAKKLYAKETERFFAETNGIKFGVSVGFSDNQETIKDASLSKDNLTAYYSYSSDFIKQNRDPHQLFEMFTVLFEYLDEQSRIELISKPSQLDVIERAMGLKSKNDYLTSHLFKIYNITSHLQIVGFRNELGKMGISLEDTLKHIYTITFPEKYGYANNARFSIPTGKTFLEKVRFIAPEFESLIKQYKLFVENNEIDYELLQISSNPISINDIPSLNTNKYIYFNDKNTNIKSISNVFFSDQTLLAYVEPYKEKKYRNFFELLSHEHVQYENYADYQKNHLKYLIDKNQIFVDKSGQIQFVNPSRILILNDLYTNSVASYYRYTNPFQKEVLQMEKENIVFFESSLFSKPEQDYFNFFLNKKEFTNGYDLRNKYLHGTQANPEDIQQHEDAYFIYLKLIVLLLLKIEDDLIIHIVLDKLKSKESNKQNNS